MILKKKLIELMYEYRIALTITIILILIVGVWGLGFILAGDRLDMHMYGNTLTNLAGQYKIYLLDVFADKGSPVIIEDIEIEGYVGLELMTTSFYMGSHEDIPFYDKPFNAEEEDLNDIFPMISDYRGQEISPFVLFNFITFRFFNISRLLISPTIAVPDKLRYPKFGK